MPEASLEICFNLPVASVWEFISDLKNIGSCLRFIEKIEKSADSFFWKVKSPTSITTRTSVLKSEFIQREERKSLSWMAKGGHLEWRGRFDLESLEQKKTKTKIELEVSGKGPMAAIINPTAALQIKNHLKYFAEELKKNLEGSGIPYCEEEGNK